MATDFLPKRSRTEGREDECLSLSSLSQTDLLGDVLFFFVGESISSSSALIFILSPRGFLGRTSSSSSSSSSKSSYPRTLLLPDSEGGSISISPPPSSDIFFSFSASDELMMFFLPP